MLNKCRNINITKLESQKSRLTYHTQSVCIWASVFFASTKTRTKSGVDDNTSRLIFLQNDDDDENSLAAQTKTKIRDRQRDDYSMLLSNLRPTPNNADNSSSLCNLRRVVVQFA